MKVWVMAALRRIYYLRCMNERFKIWLKRVGWIGFLFFLIKGLLWLLIPYLIAKGILSI